MREVSCRALGVLLHAATQRGAHAESTLLAGIPHDLAFLKSSKNRVDWDVWCLLLQNAGSMWSLEELSDLNEAFTRSPMFSYVGVIARLLFTSRDLFDWICKRSVGAGNQLFSCVTPTYSHVGNDSTVIKLEIHEGFQASPEFMWMTRGAFIAMPRLVGSGDAEVALSVDGRIGTFQIRYKNKRGTLAGLVRWISYPFTARQVARELKSTNEHLQERFYELEDARAKLDRQATRLRSAHSISSVIHSDLDLERTVQLITTSLVEQAKFAYAEITLVQPAIKASCGEANAETAIDCSLTSQTGPIGTLRVHAQRGADLAESQELLAFVEPTLALAVQNALAYRELQHYKAGLEKLVEERTTELKKAHGDLEGLVAELRDAQAAREKFFGNISHEIRTPLSLILLAAADIERRSGHVMDERSKGALGAVNDAARKLVRLVDELLLLAAGQEGKLVVAREPTDLAGMIKQVVLAWRPAAEAAGLQIAGNTPQRFVASVDPVAFERVVSNLVSNAIKYTPRGGHVDLELAVTEQSIRVSVSDTGPGIDADLAQRLFGRFERASGDDRRKVGTGIGLSLVKQLVEAHDGTVEAIARPTGGTEFRVVLPATLTLTNIVALAPTPLRTNHAPDIHSTGITSGAVFRPTGLSEGTILVAEDQPRLAESIAALFSEQYTVVVALNGLAALELVKQHQPQLLITDVEMPGMTGIELAAAFREATGDRLAPIIILSAVIDLRTRVAGLEAGAVDYVTKPFDPSELKARVQAQFRMRDLAMRLHRAEQLSSMGILTSGLAHELRNPANGIVNAIVPLTEMLPAELIGPETDAGQLLDAMRSSADQIAFLVRQLLGFRNRADLELRPTDVAPLVQRAVTLAREAMAGVEIRMNLAVKGRAMCAAPLLVQVVANLVENAGHAAGRGGWVEVRGTSAGGRISLEVSDSGPGVPPELRERIFEPFFTTKAPGKGTGLGLSVARAIIHRHHGTLEVQDRNGRTAFVLDLPGETNISTKANAV